MSKSRKDQRKHRKKVAGSKQGLVEHKKRDRRRHRNKYAPKPTGEGERDMSNVKLCNHCAGRFVESLKRHVTQRGLLFCSPECADAYFSSDNPEPYPIGLADELGLEEYE